MKNIKRSYIFIFILIVIFFISFGTSYAIFMSKSEHRGKLNIVAGDLDYKLESNDLVDNKITLKAWETKEITIELVSLNQIDSKYELYYKLNNNDNVNIGYSIDTVDAASGTIDANNTKIITVTMENLKDSSVTIEFGVVGGLINDSLVITDGNSLNGFYATQRNFAQGILLHNNLIEKEPTLTDSSNNTSDESGLYKSTATNSGEPTYYFRGNVENNYVNFAGYTWRIVRINEDGTIRLIMQDGINDNAKYSINSNYSSEDNMYYTNGDIAKLELEQWYIDKIDSDLNYSNTVANGQYYCEQAKIAYSDTYVSNSGTNMIVYDAYINPNFECKLDANNHGLINASVGLLSYDEVLHAGGYYGKSNNSYYLYNNVSWWTMSTAGFSGINANEWYVNTTGNINDNFVSNASHILRPVINLKADTVITGNGTISSPYNVYIDELEQKNLKDTILTKNEIIESEPTLTNSSNNTSDPSGLYKSTATNSGDPTYYFRGNVENNYVDFAGFTWRIVRINEDGTIRIVMQDGINDNAAYSFNTIATSKDNMYYSNSDSAKPALETWYSGKIASNENYSNSVVSGNYFCEQAKVAYSSTYASNSGADMKAYDNYISDFTCEEDGNGKGLVNASVGLLTYDEVLHAGGYYNKSNSNYYLYNSAIKWWTMSPAGYSGSYVDVWGVHNTGDIDPDTVSSALRLCPVINLKADTIVTGLGTSSKPYKVQ